MTYSSTIVKNPETGYFTGQIFKHDAPIESTAPQRSFTNAKRLLNKRIESHNIMYGTKIPPNDLKERNVEVHFPISQVGATVKAPIIEQRINQDLTLAKELIAHHGQPAKAVKNREEITKPSAEPPKAETKSKAKAHPQTTQEEKPMIAKTVTPTTETTTIIKLPQPPRITGVQWNEDNDEITIITGKRRIKLTLDAIEKAMIIQKGILNLAKKLNN